MSHSGDFEPEFPSEEELEALFRADDGEDDRASNGDSVRDAAGTAPEALEGVRAPRFLIVSRRDHDLKVLTTVLGRRRVDISLARNPFTALDYLRARDFDVVVTDFGLWSASGSLLFRRIDALDRPVRVVFLCGGNGELATIDLLERCRATTPARAALASPLDSRRASELVDELLGELGGPGALDDSLDLPHVEPRRLRPRSAREAPPPLESPPPPGDPEVRGGPDSERAASSRSLADDPMLPWWKFYFEARSAIREAGPGERGLETVLRGLRETLGADVVAWLLDGAGDVDLARQHLFVVGAELATGFVGEEDRRRWLRRVHARLAGDEAGRQPDGSLHLELELDALRRGVLIAVPLPDRSLREFPRSAQNELGPLLRETLSGSPEG